MKIIQHTVSPSVPEELEALYELAHNMWLSWNFEAVQLFMRADYDAWIASRQNPARMLGMISQRRLDELARDDSFISALTLVHEKFLRYRNGETWYKGIV